MKVIHYKGGEYSPIAIVKHTEEPNELVLYQDAKGQFWVRPDWMFFDGRFRAAPTGSPDLVIDDSAGSVRKMVELFGRMEPAEAIAPFEFEEAHGYGFQALGKLLPEDMMDIPQDLICQIPKLMPHLKLMWSGRHQLWGLVHEDTIFMGYDSDAVCQADCMEPSVRAGQLMMERIKVLHAHISEPITVLKTLAAVLGAGAVSEAPDGTPVLLIHGRKYTVNGPVSPEPPTKVGN